MPIAISLLKELPLIHDSLLLQSEAGTVLRLGNYLETLISIVKGKRNDEMRRMTGERKHLRIGIDCTMQA